MELVATNCWVPVLPQATEASHNDAYLWFGFGIWGFIYNVVAGNWGACKLLEYQTPHNAWANVSVHSVQI